MIKLGDKVRDVVTGFEGIAIGRTQWLNGCARVTVQPDKLDGGKTLPTETFDEPQLSVVKAGKVPLGEYAPESTASSKKPGGPIPEQKQRATPSRF